MKLEEHIKQKKFVTQLEKALVNITFTNSVITGKLNKQFKPYNISIQQFNVMRILKGQHPKAVSVNDIADRMVDKMSNASRLVEKLRIKGLIKRTQSPSDKRQVDIHLTKSGLSQLEILNEIVDNARQDFRHISEEEYEVLNTILDKMRK